MNEYRHPASERASEADGAGFLSVFSYACPASAGRLHPMTNERSSLLFLCESRKEEFLRTSDSMVLYARTYGPYEEASKFSLASSFFVFFLDVCLDDSDVILFVVELTL